MTIEIDHLAEAVAYSSYADDRDTPVDQSACAATMSIAHSLIALVELLDRRLPARAQDQEPLAPPGIDLAADPDVSVNGWEINVYDKTVKVRPADVRYDRIDVICVRPETGDVGVLFGKPAREPVSGGVEERYGFVPRLEVRVPARSRALSIENVRDVRPHA